MKYIEVTFRIAPIDPYKDLLIYNLGDEGPYDSFVDTDDGMKAYVPADQFDESFLNSQVDALVELSKTLLEPGMTVEPLHVSFQVAEMPDKDWNAEWEKQHQAVLVEDFCWVRAPFHPHRNDVQYEIEIEPKMSFGTAHHATTYMMLTLLRDEDLQGKSLLDMGTGTAVLAILAAMRGASPVEGVDVDEWAYRNALENVERNGVEVSCRLGDATTLGEEPKYDVVLANINRNILLHDMAAYVRVLCQGGSLLMSGFYEHDIPKIRACAEGLGLTFDRNIVRNDWTAVRFIKG